MPTHLYFGKRLCLFSHRSTRRIRTDAFNGYPSEERDFLPHPADEKYPVSLIKYKGIGFLF